MIELELSFENGDKQRQQHALPLRIGKATENDIHLKSWRVAKQHARLHEQENEIFIEDFGSIGGTLVNGQRINHFGPLKIGDQIIIGPCQLTIRSIYAPAKGSDQTLAEPSSLNISDDDKPSKNEMLSVTSSSKDHESRSLEPERSLNHENLIVLRQELHQALLEALDLRRRDISEVSDSALRAEASEILNRLIAENKELDPQMNTLELAQSVLDEAIGLGVLESLLSKPSITEIMVNRYNEIYIEEKGLLQRTTQSFSSETALRRIIERIVSPLGRRIDDSSPMVDARLPDGSRVNAVINPIALKGTCLTIRKFPLNRPGINDLIQLASLDQYMASFLSLCVTYKKNIIVSGGTGSGKTTLLNILSNFIPQTERIITIEDAAELKLNHPHLIAMESRPANLEGRGEILIRDLVRNALRMRPDRIVVGECRGKEAFDMMTAMNTGHEGSLTTLHANSARDALSRLETMVLMAGMDLPLTAIREHIASSIDFIIQQDRIAGGRRVITSITEVCGLESGIIKIQDIFKYHQNDTGYFVGSGIIPDCFEYSHLKQALDINMFNHKTPANPSTTYFH